MKSNRRLHLLLAGSALLVSVVRAKLQYGHFWSSWSTFLGSWFIHYLGILFMAWLFMITVLKFGPAFLEKDRCRSMSVEESMAYTGLFFIVLSMVVLLVQLVSGGGGAEDLGLF
jgi:hypothetical protein